MKGQESTSRKNKPIRDHTDFPGANQDSLNSADQNIHNKYAESAKIRAFSASFFRQ